MAYTTGTNTYTAYEDIPANVVVVLRGSSDKSPMEVELASNDSPQLLGVSVTAASEGDLVTIQPFDSNGTYQIKSAGTIAKGSSVYVYSSNDGTINDEVRTAFVGKALNSGVVNELITVAFVMRDVSDHTINASDVDITDAGGYFVSDNVEGALQEIGETSELHGAAIGENTGYIGDLQDFDSNLTASQVALVDAGGHYTGTEVEAALAAVGTGLDSYRVADWQQFENTRFGAGGGNPPTATGALIGSSTSGFKYVLNGAYYGNYRLESSTGTFTVYLVNTYRPTYKVILSAGEPFETDISYYGAFTTGSAQVTSRITVCDDYNAKYSTPYTAHPILSSATPLSLALTDINAGDTALNFRYITVFMRFDFTSIDVPITLEGFRHQYHTKRIY